MHERPTGQICVVRSNETLQLATFAAVDSQSTMAHRRMVNGRRILRITLRRGLILHPH